MKSQFPLQASMMRLNLTSTFVVCFKYSIMCDLVDFVVVF